MSQRTSLVEPFSAAKFLTGSGATLDALVSELAQGASVLEFITHGVHDFGRRRPAGLVLTPANDDDGVLWCEDIEERLSVPPLVVLLACGTAFGPTRLGDDTAALLGNSFLLRGADVVLLSRTSVEYGAMLALAGAFHRHLADTDTSPAEALRRARIDLAGLAIWSDIRHHGQICLFGLGLAPLPMRFEPAPEPTKVADSAVRAWLLAAAAVGAVAAIAARTWIRRRAAISARV